MAERRMFAKSIVLSDAFLDMPLSARCLYFTLGMLADDDGFIGNPKSIMRQCGSSQDDMLALLQKRYILAFDSGVIVIKHWRMNNYLQSDRHKSTTYLEELNTLMVDEKGAYTEKEKPMYTECIQTVYTDKDSIDKYSLEKKSRGKSSKENNIVSETDTAIQEVIDYLNSKTGKHYTYNNKSYNRLISARLKEKYTVEDFKTVIDKKCNDWLGNEMEQYLKPTTLFAPSHFEDYLNQTTVKGKPNVMNRVTEVDNWI